MEKRMSLQREISMIAIVENILLHEDSLFNSRSLFDGSYILFCDVPFYIYSLLIVKYHQTTSLTRTSFESSLSPRAVVFIFYHLKKWRFVHLFIHSILFNYSFAFFQLRCSLKRAFILLY